MSAPPRLVIDNVSFAYDGRAVLSDVSLALWPGRVIGLLGPNGAGKSTLLWVVAGLLRPWQGNVRLEGQSLQSMRRMAVARAMAVVPQHAIMPDAFTGWEVVILGRTPHVGALRGTSPADEAIAQRALALVDATHLADRRVGELSGGEQQRLLLARALVQEPTVLLLDEPTTHLDLPHQLAILELLLRVAREQRLAILAVFHDLNLASAYCDEIVLMRDGRILAHGTPAETLSSTAIEMVYDLRVPVIPHPETGRPVVLVPAPHQEVPQSASTGGTASSLKLLHSARDEEALAIEEALAR